MLRKNFANIVAINIPSFAAGCDLWGSTSKIGLKKFNQTLTEEYTEFKGMDKGDKTLEFVAFSRQMTLGMEKICNGWSYKIA